MLFQTDIYTKPANTENVYSDIAVKIHGAAMKAIPPDYSSKMHISAYHPFSIFTVPIEDRDIIRISALCNDAKIIPDILSEKKSIRIYGMTKPLEFAEVEISEPINAINAGEYLSKKGCRVTFITPAVIKTNGRFSAAPDISSYFYSTICKYNEFENDNISFDYFKDAFAESFIGEYSLESVKYNVSGHAIPGMTGYFDIYFPENPVQNAVLRKVISYATYSGTGGKTSMGMGGIIAENI